MELARLLTLANIAMADAGIACWDSKYFYDIWRPITGIRESDAGTGPTGAGDGNAATVGDPAFSPLGMRGPVPNSFGYNGYGSGLGSVSVGLPVRVGGGTMTVHVAGSLVSGLLR